MFIATKANKMGEKIIKYNKIVVTYVLSISFLETLSIMVIATTVNASTRSFQETFSTMYLYHKLAKFNYLENR